MTSMNALVLAAALAVFATSGCDKGSEDATQAEPAESAEGSDGKAATKKSRKRKRRVKKDRGDASVKIGDTVWEATSARAKLKSGTLRIKASRLDMVGKKASSQQLSLVLPDYKGPGTYQARSAGSVFIGVGLDTDELEKADTDKKATEVATKAVTKAKTILLMKTTVVVESANDTEIVGTFSQPALGKRYPALADGKFRAILKK